MEKKYCKLCHKELTEQQIKRGKQYCGRSCALKVAYQNPEVRKRVSEATKAALADPEVQERHRAGSKKAYQNPEVRQRVSEATKAALNTPEAKKKMQDAQKRIWQNLEYREKISQIRKETWKSIEFKEHFSKVMSNKWAEPGYRERVGQKIKESLSKPEVKSRRSLNLKRALADPITKQRQRTASKLLANNPETKRKIIETKRLNGTFNTSKEEKWAKELFDKDSIKYIYQYKDGKYPFHCDFYLQDLDIYLELNCHWTHGFEPYIESKETCKLLLSKWQDKVRTSAYYRRAIYVWTSLDIRKRQCAIDNKLNWKCFYTYEEFLNWYNSEVKHD